MSTAAGLEPRHIVVEITESAAIQDFSKTGDVLRCLREAGFKVVLDDFGTGYSSLACLHQLPISGLKLDRSFIGAIDQHAELIRAVLVLSKSLDLMVTAEGIETREQYEHLQALGCDFGQGYLFARPMDSDRRWQPDCGGGPIVPAPLHVCAGQTAGTPDERPADSDCRAVTRARGRPVKP